MHVHHSIPLPRATQWRPQDTLRKEFHGAPMCKNLYFCREQLGGAPPRQPPSCVARPVMTPTNTVLAEPTYKSATTMPSFPCPRILQHLPEKNFNLNDMKSLAVVVLCFAAALAQPLGVNGTMPNECRGCGHLPKVHEWQTFTPKCQDCLAMCRREHDYNVCGFARCHKIVRFLSF